MREIKPIKKLDATVRTPGSKSYTQRALIIASLAKGSSLLTNPLISEDTQYLIDALCFLGGGIRFEGEDMVITGHDEKFAGQGRRLFLGNNGTAMRFLTSLVSLGKGVFHIDGGSRLRERPVQPLVNALCSLGVDCRSVNGKGCPPVTVIAKGIEGGKVVFTDLNSSQYISSVLIAAPYARNDIEIELRGYMPSMPYVDMTINIMNHFGVDVTLRGDNGYSIRVPQSYTGTTCLIEGDVSSASYFFLAAALCKGKVKVMNVNLDTLQGDIGLLGILETLGCSVRRGGYCVEVMGADLNNQEMEFNMADMPDMVPTLAVLSAFRKGRTAIRNVSSLRLKESNRIEALVTELRKMGVYSKELKDGLLIEGGNPHGAEIETYNDHRIAMSFAVAGLAVEGVRIRNSICVKKSFPGFWDELSRLSS
ncbi:MAG TPA: 3-phosphoshikimate 1-carboxyvinyltransferase [Desulfobacteraceae bacterium]|nr:3-phosphoshikimate 1-carboxyvinyltransferase [Desulfobacteraceae bacterium]HPJ68495.1 3-phosphoshikimate 1-carboxyvinyltransferase [Desulfobacteraceae bacterium]HPQ27253.1 3-phosphoshikimate 1-carboxyvinyltransferase [Desulfobacteraceae bacterium]